MHGDPRCLRCAGELQARHLRLTEGWLRGSLCRVCGRKVSRWNAHWRCANSCGFRACSGCVADESCLPHASSRVVSSERLRIACRYGVGCYQVSSEHLEKYAHPGDKDYRQGRVILEEGQRPDLGTLWEIFTFFDPRQSGHLSREEFALALREVPTALPELPDQASAWTAAGGDEHGHVSFVRFAAFCGRIVARMPVGLDLDVNCVRRCQLQGLDGTGCTCENFRAVSSKPMSVSVCRCGHRETAHRSDAAGQSLGSQLTSCRPRHWLRGTSGLVSVTDPAIMASFQFLLDATHKEDDNWTRDRGCALHGVNKCKPPCAYKNRAPVPSGYKLVQLKRNQNPLLWARYCLMRASILDECANGGCQSESVETAQSPFQNLDGPPLIADVNEWRLFHGTSHASCTDICAKNFRLDLVGTGASWKDSSFGTGTPLYGRGIYFSERITKADEYAGQVDLEVTSARSGTAQLCCVLIGRAVGGRANVCTTNEINPELLRRQVLDGPSHSIIGDRVRDLGKPYREIVIYDRDQVYPEFLLIYERITT